MAATTLKDPEIKMETEFFYAQASQPAGQIPQAITAYEKLLDSKTEHRYRERAELELARLALEQGNNAKALKHFDNLAAKSKDPELKDEAGFRAGVLALETSTPERGVVLLRRRSPPARTPRLNSWPRWP